MTLPFLKAEEHETEVYPEELNKKQVVKAVFTWKDAEARGLSLMAQWLWQHTAMDQFMVQTKPWGWAGFSWPSLCSAVLQLLVSPLKQLKYLPVTCSAIFALQHRCTQYNITYNPAKTTSGPIKCSRNTIIGSSRPSSSFIYFALFSRENKSHSYNWVTCLN